MVKAVARARMKARHHKKPRAVKGEIVSPPVPNAWDISVTTLMKSRMRTDRQYVDAFKITGPMPGVVPKGHRIQNGIAMDDAFGSQQIITANAWAAEAVYNGAFYNGLAFMGFPYLSELAQRPEYRRLTEILATEMTRKWVQIKSKNDDQREKKDQVDQLTQYMDKVDVRGLFRKLIEIDGFFGRAHLYIDTGDMEKPDELMTSIGNGDAQDPATMVKYGNRKDFLSHECPFKAIEPVWTYPAKYNAQNPLSPDWYYPQTWFCMGKELHRTRLISLVGREVPDMLKPSYQFGGLSLSQLAKPYVDNWLRTRQAVADLIWTFSVMVLSTDLQTILAGDGQQLFDRAALFANLRTNQGLMLVNKESEELKNVSAPISGLEALQAQSQEHMCSVTGTPVVKLLGIQPAGLNASSAGELEAWSDWVAAFQEKFVRRPLTTVMNFCQRNLWGQVDPDITFEFLPLEEMSEAELATLRKTEADTDNSYVAGGILDVVEVRQRIANDPESPYEGLEVEDVPAPPGGMGGEEDGDMGSALGLIGGRGPSSGDPSDGGEEGSDRRGGGREGGRDPAESGGRRESAGAGASQPTSSAPPDGGARQPRERTNRPPRAPRPGDR